MDGNARAFDLCVPGFVHWRALKDGEEYFGNVVGEDDKGEAPEESSEAGKGAKDAVEEEKGGVFEGRSPDAVEHFH